MKNMPTRAQRWLKILHLLLAALWLASAITLVLLPLFVQPERNDALYGAMLAMKFIDDFIIIPAANGCLLTGIVYGIWTHWGFFRHRWVIVKWVVTLYGIIVGTIWLGPWMNRMVVLAEELGGGALSNPEYLHMRSMNLLWGGIQAGTLLLALVVSVLKPWKKKPKTP